MRTRVLVTAGAIPALIAKAVGVLGRDIAVSDDEIFAVVGEVTARIDIGDDEAVAVDDAPNARTIEAAFPVARRFEKQFEPRHVAIDAGVDFALRPHHAPRPGVLAGTDIGERRVGTGIDPCRVATTVEVAGVMRHATAGTADIDILDFIGVLSDFQRIFLQLHREPGAPAFDRVVVEIVCEEAVEITAGRHDQLPVELPFGRILGEGDLARLLGRDMAEMLVVLCLIPGLVMPGRGLIAAVGKTQLLADLPVDVANIGAGERDAEPRIGGAYQQLLPGRLGLFE